MVVLARDPAPRAAAGPADHRAALRRPAALGARADPRGAGPAPADGARRARLRLLQRAVDVAGVPALRRRRTTTATAVIGLFGLVGVAGALAASVAGRLADRGHGAPVTTASILIMLASWGVLALGKSSVVALIVGIAAARPRRPGPAHLQPERDLRAAPRGPQPADHRLHGQPTSWAAPRCRRSAAALYGSDGWGGVCVLGAVTALLALVVWAVTEARARARSRRAAAGAGDAVGMIDG